MSSWFETCVHVVRHTLVIIGVLVVGGVVAALVIMYSGMFNVAATVAATVADSSALSWAPVTVREASIELHARDVPAPATGMVTDPDNGFRIYRRECVMCHTPAGHTPQTMAVGFNPQAPNFGPGADDMSGAELFWVTKNGIRFTGMPAWGPSLKDSEISDVVAFVMAMPKMTAADYDAIDKRIPATGAEP